jgi:hypothetical protein
MVFTGARERLGRFRSFGLRVQLRGSAKEDSVKGGYSDGSEGSLVRFLSLNTKALRRAIFSQIDEQLTALDRRAWDHIDLNAEGLIAKRSITILFFGDLDARRNSALKVLTEGLSLRRSFDGVGGLRAAQSPRWLK